MIWGEKGTDIVRCCGLHFALGCLVGTVVFWLATHNTGWDLVRFGLLGGLVGVLVDLDHWFNTQGIGLADPGRPLHIPMGVVAFGVLIYCVVRMVGQHTTSTACLIGVVASASVVAHVLEDYLLGWF